TRRGRVLTIEPVVDVAGSEMLYILSIYLPRFQNLDLAKKLIRVLQELWPISPDFNGDIRRHAGRYHAHTHSQAQYDEEMGRLADHWLEDTPPEHIWYFLRDDSRQLPSRHGAIRGLKYRRPRLLPVPGSPVSS